MRNHDRAVGKKVYGFFPIVIIIFAFGLKPPDPISIPPCGETGPLTTNRSEESAETNALAASRLRTSASGLISISIPRTDLPVSCPINPCTDQAGAASLPLLQGCGFSLLLDHSTTRLERIAELKNSVAHRCRLFCSPRGCRPLRSKGRVAEAYRAAPSSRFFGCIYSTGRLRSRLALNN